MNITTKPNQVQLNLYMEIRFWLTPQGVKDSCLKPALFMRNNTKQSIGVITALSPATYVQHGQLSILHLILESKSQSTSDEK